MKKIKFTITFLLFLAGASILIISCADPIPGWHYYGEVKGNIPEKGEYDLKYTLYQKAETDSMMVIATRGDKIVRSWKYH